MVAAARFVVLAAALAVAGCGGGGARRGPVVRADGPVVRLVAPALDGGELDLAAWRGRIVVVHFFTTSSLAAALDLDELRAARAAAAPGEIVLLGIGLDEAGYAFVAPWRDAERVDWHVALPTAELRAGRTAFGDVMRFVPSTFVLDRAGRIAWSRRGQLARGELVEVVRSLEARAAAP